MKLSQINEVLNRKVIGQELAKRKLFASLYCDKNMKILLSGPSGCGKTYLVDTLAEILGVKCCHIDGSKLTQTGYAGNTIEDSISEFINSAGGNLSVVENSIIFIDEFDKIHSQKNEVLNDSISNLGVQYELLKFFDGKELVVEYNHRKTIVNTSCMTIICAGAFSYNEGKVLGKVDLVNCGFIEELAGRINAYISMDGLTEQDMICILKNRDLPFINKYFAAFNNLDEEFILGDSEMEELARLSARSPFGVRYLEGLLYDKVISRLYDVMLNKDVEIWNEKNEV